MLGLKVIDSINSTFLFEFAELIAKKVTSPYMASIYDFKKKMHH